MCSDYCFDVILTVPEVFCEDLPEAPEPVVKFLTNTYINVYRFKPTDDIISEKQMRDYLKDNQINTDKCSIIQRPKTNTFEALINGYQMYRVHWLIECEFDEERHYMIIPKVAREFIDSVHEIIHENTLATLDIMNNSLPWEDSWIYKKVSYAEFRAHALCNHADEIFDNLEQKNNETIQTALKNIQTSLDKRIKNIDSSIYVQHSNLLQDVKRFEERIKKQLSKLERPKETIDYEAQIEELIHDNAALTEELKTNRLSMVCLTMVQVLVIALLMIHYFTFK